MASSSDPCIDILDELKACEPSDKKFRLSARKYILTYKTHLPKEEYISWFKDSKNRPDAEIWVSHENADPKNPYEHSHVLIDLKSRADWTNPRVFDFQGIHPNIKAILKPTHWKNCIRYMCKEDKSNLDLLELLNPKSFAEKVWNCKDVQEALTKYGAVEDMDTGHTQFLFNQIISLYAFRPSEVWDMDEVLPQVWQRSALGWLDDDRPSDRIVLNIYTEKGCSGKTYFCKWLAMNRSKEALVLACMPNTRDLATIVANAIASGWTGKFCVINLVRADVAKDIYGPLEALTDGLLTAVKYQGKPIHIPSVKVIILSNHPLNTKAMSQSRIKVWDVDDPRYLDRSLFQHRNYINDYIPKDRKKNKQSPDIHWVIDQNGRQRGIDHSRGFQSYPAPSEPICSSKQEDK
nr:MAG: replication associated protein [Arizlama virus]